jgi:hypothetical protein
MIFNVPFWSAELSTSSDKYFVPVIFYLLVWLADISAVSAGGGQFRLGTFFHGLGLKGYERRTVAVIVERVSAILGELVKEPSCHD